MASKGQTRLRLPPARIAWTLGRLATSVALALLTMRLLYGTEAGIRLLDMIPEGVWEAYHRLAGVRTGYVEEQLDAEFWPMFAVSLAASAAVVWAATNVLARVRAQGSAANRAR
jgi:hypothetical protein